MQSLVPMSAAPNCAGATPRRLGGACCNLPVARPNASASGWDQLFGLSQPLVAHKVQLECGWAVAEATVQPYEPSLGKRRAVPVMHALNSVAETGPRGAANLSRLPCNKWPRPCVSAELSWPPCRALQQLFAPSTILRHAETATGTPAARASGASSLCNPHSLALPSRPQPAGAGAGAWAIEAGAPPWLRLVPSTPRRRPPAAGSPLAGSPAGT